MKSETLSQFQSVLQELDEFGRGKDKQQRKKRAAQGLTDALGAVGINKIKGKTLNTTARQEKAKNIGKAGAALALGAIGVAKRKNIGSALKGAGMIGKNAAKQAGKNVATQANKTGETLGKAVSKVKQTVQNQAAKGERIAKGRKASKKVSGLLPGISKAPRTINIS